MCVWGTVRVMNSLAVVGRWLCRLLCCRIVGLCLLNIAPLVSRASWGSIVTGNVERLPSFNNNSNNKGLYIAR